MSGERDIKTVEQERLLSSRPGANRLKKYMERKDLAEALLNMQVALGVEYLRIDGVEEAIVLRMDRGDCISFL